MKKTKSEIEMTVSILSSHLIHIINLGNLV
jgi:hypothetical protein